MATNKGVRIDHRKGIFVIPEDDESTSNPSSGRVSFRVNSSGNLVTRNSGGDEVETTSHARSHALDSSDDHTGIFGDEDNFMSLDVDGLPQDSGSAASDFDVAGAADTAVGDHELTYDHNNLHVRLHDLDSVTDHNGVSGGTPGNLVTLNANNLPEDSGYNPSDFAGGLPVGDVGSLLVYHGGWTSTDDMDARDSRLVLTPSSSIVTGGNYSAYKATLGSGASVTGNYGLETDAPAKVRSLEIGDKTTDYNKIIYVENGDVYRPFLQYDEIENQWEYSNDGQTATAIGSGGGGSTSPTVIEFPAGSFDYPTANPAPLDLDTGANSTVLRQLFDDTTEEYVGQLIELPSDMDEAGDLTIYARGYATTANSDVFIQIGLDCSAYGGGESWDVVPVRTLSGDVKTNPTQDYLDYFSWTVDFVTLGWNAGAQVRFRFFRTATDAQVNLTGDWGLTNLILSIPRS